MSPRPPSQSHPQSGAVLSQEHPLKPGTTLCSKRRNKQHSAHINRTTNPFPHSGEEGTVTYGCWFCPSEHRRKVLTRPCLNTGWTPKLPGAGTYAFIPPGTTATPSRKRICLHRSLDPVALGMKTCIASSMEILATL